MTLKGRFDPRVEVADVAVSQETMEFNRTGNWRYLRPMSIEKLAPCRRLCPAGTDIPRVLSLVASGRHEEAYRLVRSTNPLPAVCGRVCYHPCESECTRKSIDSGIAVQGVERFLGELGLDLPEDPPAALRTPRTVAVLGSGPAGLTCAYFLARNGVPVRIFEAEAETGGMLRSGIPAYRLSREVLDREIAKIAAAGVEIETGCPVDYDRFDSLQRDFGAVFVSTGAHLSRRLSFPVETGLQVFSGLDFLQSVNRGDPLTLGARTVVIGGGNTAMDAARSAVRQGADVVVVYRRTANEMPAHRSEVEEAESEGVDFVFLASPVGVRRRHSGLAVEFVRMKLGSPDSGGRRRPVEIPGSNRFIEADSLIVAVGEEPDLSFSRRDTNVFFGGDAVTGPSTVVDAIAAGRRGASEILRFLDLKPTVPLDPSLPTARFCTEDLNRDYFSPLPRVRERRLPPEARLSGFAEIVSTLPRSAIDLESCRCLSCGVCNECNNCWLFCPDGAIHRHEGHYVIDLEYCKGCGICVEECPRGVIELVEEQS